MGCLPSVRVVVGTREEMGQLVNDDTQRVVVAHTPVLLRPTTALQRPYDPATTPEGPTEVDAWRGLRIVELHISVRIGFGRIVVADEVRTSGDTLEDLAVHALDVVGLHADAEPFLQPLPLLLLVHREAGRPLGTGYGLLHRVHGADHDFLVQAVSDVLELVVALHDRQGNLGLGGCRTARDFLEQPLDGPVTVPGAALPVRTLESDPLVQGTLQALEVAGGFGLLVLLQRPVDGHELGAPRREDPALRFAHPRTVVHDRHAAASGLNCEPIPPNPIPSPGRHYNGPMRIPPPAAMQLSP